MALPSPAYQAPQGAPSPTGAARRGKFIVFEGLDGSGKSTQIALLARRLREAGRRVFCTAEPTDSATGGLIRDTLSGRYSRSSAELAALFLTDRISHNVDPVRGIQGLLDGGADVISDRYYYSSFAYQGVGTDMTWVVGMNLNCPDIRRPDLCIFLDVDYRQCKARLDRDRAHLEIFERDEATLEAVSSQFYRVFRLLEGQEPIRIVDAGRPPEQVAEEVFRLVSELE